MPSSDRNHSQHDDDQQLRELGYPQQLLRAMGGFSNFAVSFSTISILTGAVTLYGHGLRFGGPWVMTAGWPLVSLMTMAVAASLAELASAYPTAGALYHWAAIHGGRGWGFLTAGLNVFAQFSVIAGVDYGLAEFVTPLLGFSGRESVLLAYSAILVSHAALNHVGVRVVGALNTISAWYHVLGVAILISAIGWWAPKHPVAFLLTRYTTSTHAYAYAFLIGLLQAQWTFTGYDASAHVTEETHDPTRNAPRGIVLSVALSAVVGYAMLLVFTLAIGDLPESAAADNPFVFILFHALGDRWGSVLIWMVMGAMWFCGLASVTSASRTVFAFSRDGGLPASKQWARVSDRFKTPYLAIWLSVIAALAIALWTEAYAAMVALSTLAFYASYGLPIWLGFRAKRRATWTRFGPWSLGVYSSWINLIALAWIAVVTVLFVLPPNQLAGYTFVGCLLAIGLFWFAYQRTRFVGPARLGR